MTAEQRACAIISEWAPNAEPRHYLRLAERITKAIEDAEARAAGEEREACARLADERAHYCCYAVLRSPLDAEEIAAAIRARGSPAATQNGSESGGGE